jgi:NAD(P)-dependent dehydrogenase (short-subunit alcohol dehydrogenase family)
VANISSIMGSIAENGQGGSVAYRSSKTALNMVNKCLALANPRIVFLAMHPGWVHTDMGGASAPVKPEASAAGLLAQIARADATRSGTFVRFDGAQAAW